MLFKIDQGSPPAVDWEDAEQNWNRDDSILRSSGSSFFRNSLPPPVLPGLWISGSSQSMRSNSNNTNYYSRGPNCQKPRMKKTTPPAQSSPVLLGFHWQKHFTYFLRSCIAQQFSWNQRQMVPVCLVAGSWSHSGAKHFFTQNPEKTAHVNSPPLLESCYTKYKLRLT
ncbi:uncharacterized protein [Vicugna pacos]|uniref:Uncharacterized protein isoform X5 n=1 Tax=Vicugna pacos TaxID=30538 RepID=A0ABM5E5N2_VICPA